MAYDDSRFRGEPGFRDEPDPRLVRGMDSEPTTVPGGLPAYPPGTYPVGGIGGNGYPAETDSTFRQGMRRFFELAASDPRVTGTAVQTVGAKGHDGFAILLVTTAP